MSNSFINKRNKMLLETLMNSKFHKSNKNFILNERTDMQWELQIEKKPFGPVTEAEGRALGRIVNFAGHMALDILGVFDPTPAADLLNAAWYALERDYLNVIFSLIGAAVPYVFEGLKLSFRTAWEAYKVGGKASFGLLLEALQKVGNFIKNYSKQINDVIYTIMPTGSYGAITRDWVLNKITRWDSLLDSLRQANNAVGQDVVKNVSKAFEDFFGSTVQMTKGVVDTNLAKRYKQALDLSSGSRKIIVAAQAGLWWWLSDPLQQFMDKEIRRINFELQKIQNEALAFKAYSSAEDTEEQRAQKEMAINLLIPAIQFLYVFETANKNADLAAFVLASLPPMSIGGSPSKMVQAALKLNLINQSQADTITSSINTVEAISSQPPDQKNKEKSTWQKFKEEIAKKMQEWLGELVQRTLDAEKEKAKALRTFFTPEMLKNAMLLYKKSRELNEYKAFKKYL